MSLATSTFVDEVAAGHHPVDVATLRYSEDHTNPVAGVPAALVEQGEWAR